MGGGRVSSDSQPDPFLFSFSLALFPCSPPLPPIPSPCVSALLHAMRLPSAKNLRNVGLQWSDKVCFVPAVT